MQISNTLSALGLFTAILFTSMSIQAEIYKWTDENGRTHYSDKRPDKTVHVDKVKVSTGTAAKQANKPKPNTKEKEQALQKKAETLSKNRGSKTVKKDEAACTAAQNRLSKYTDGARLRINDKGQMRFLSQKEIQSRRANAEKFIAENC